MVEFQTSASDKPGAGGAGTHRKRLGALLSPEDLERVRHIQDSVIEKLSSPLNAFVSALPAEVRRHDLAQFEADLGTCIRHSDLWLRYHNEEELRRWGEFIVEALPGMVSRLVQAHNA